MTSATSSKGGAKPTHKQSRLSLSAAGPVDESSRKRKAGGATSTSATASRRSLATQKNTLDSWFGRAAPVKKQREVVDVSHADEDREPHVTTPRAKAVARSPSKKLVQRRILLSDLCRVCESARTDETTRCELKCIDCEMTVHRSCYGVDADGKNVGSEWDEDNDREDDNEEDEDEEDAVPPPPEKWRCRPCAVEWKQQQQTVASKEDNATSAIRKAPVHVVCGDSGPFHGVYHDSDFAAIYLFFKRFRRLGLRVTAEVTLSSLALALLSPENHVLLTELHTRLLQNVGVSLSKTQNWLAQVIKFLRSREDEFEAAKTLFDALTAASGDDSDAWLTAYNTGDVHDRVVILKALCEVQFDENDALISKIGEQDDPESLRDGPIGVDSRKRTYYALEDAPSVLEGSAWLCRCDQQHDATWETVADDLSSLRSFLRSLAFSRETADLQLWQTLKDGVYKSLERREKKRRQQAQRLARMPRLLGKTGLDMASTLGLGGDSEPVIGRRSLRTRRAVNYRGLVGDDDEEDEEEEEAEDDGDSSGDGQDDDDDDNDGSDEERSPRKRQRVQPTRTSSRLRGHAPATAAAAAVASSGEEEAQDDEEKEEEEHEDVRSRPQRSSRRRLVRHAVDSDEEEEEEEEEDEEE
ncbi:hypothetical protein PINS_up014718 [Pythium insidiosum]|nr:hypothetical protein PINS_up014718 [Pythium insidiosum]